MAVPSRGRLLPLPSAYRHVRALTEGLTAPLAAEDQVVQSMPDVSPTKWHLAHTTWFFEAFVLEPFQSGYRSPHPDWHYLFNSYYYTVGAMHARDRRGLLSRPTVAEVAAYRAAVDEAVGRLLEARHESEELAFRVTLGLHHEQQHQELLLTDIKHVLFGNPLAPAYDERLPRVRPQAAPPARWLPQSAGAREIGARPEDGFCFDNETPRHRVELAAHELAERPVTNGEYREFIRAGGYRDPALWLADGWGLLQREGWSRPLYWAEDLEREFTLGGWRELSAGAPVAHVSYYEADAFARWAGARLPSEAEWEAAAAAQPVAGNFLDSGSLQPQPVPSQSRQPAALFGDVWEWTASPYVAYPGFRPLAGSLGEYNGKFMCNQMTVRGGSCLSSRDHLRASYRSFFYPHQRWQVLGFRLARDAEA